MGKTSRKTRPGSVNFAKEDSLLVAAGLMRLPQESLKVSELFKIPTGTVSNNAAMQAVLDDREQGL